MLVLGLFTMRLVLLTLLFLAACTSNESDKQQSKTPQVINEKIARKHDDHSFALSKIKAENKPLYDWENYSGAEFPKITKDFFRCKGHILNTVRLSPQGKEVVRYYDCGGSQRHSLPLRDGKEFIYPILIDLLNYLQTKTGKRVVITCGHRCPDHNMYVDSSPSNQASKHLIGAEVDFYIQGMEYYPNKVMDLIKEYYKETPRYKGLKEFQEFIKYEKRDTDVSISPLYNKEIFVKIYKSNEGRDFDNRHPYPYISIQVRFDWDTQEKVQYSWDQAFRNFHRY